MRLMRVVHSGVQLRRRVRGPKRPSWSPELETFATFLHFYASQSVRLPVKWQRGAAEKIVPKSDAIDAIRFERIDAGGVPAEWARRDGCDESRVLLYLHGGGYMIGSVDSHRDLIARLAGACGCPVLAPDYRLAPEHRFPAQLEDALAVYRYLVGTGIPAERIVVGGESAGGGLTLSTLCSLRDAGEALPAGAVLLSPWVCLEPLQASIETNARFDYLSRRSLEAAATHFLGKGGDRRNPLAAPIYADLAGLPPMLIHVGGAEILLDQDLEFARRARDAGVEVELDVWPDMIHAWHLFADLAPEAREAIARIGSFVRKQSAASGQRPARLKTVKS